MSTRYEGIYVVRLLGRVCDRFESTVRSEVLQCVCDER